MAENHYVISVVIEKVTFDYPSGTSDYDKRSFKASPTQRNVGNLVRIVTTESSLNRAIDKTTKILAIERTEEK
jgi:hypothetical protein